MSEIMRASNQSERDLVSKMIPGQFYRSMTDNPYCLFITEEGFVRRRKARILSGDIVMFVHAMNRWYLNTWGNLIVRTSLIFLFDGGILELPIYSTLSWFTPCLFV